MKDESIKMEFLLTLNDNIVVQRYFNVKNYNYDAKNSNEYHELIEKMKKEGINKRITLFVCFKKEKRVEQRPLLTLAAARLKKKSSAAAGQWRRRRYRC